jgi:uncharacterized membrane protein HdeD (DUF308 family)
MQEIASERQNNGSVILGVLLIILGAIAIASPLFAALVLTRVLGWLLIFAAIEQVIHAFRSKEGGVFLKVLLAVLYVLAGGMLLRRPASGAIAATAIIGLLLVTDGIMEIALSAQLHREKRGWLFAGGVLSLFLGALILYRLPWSMAAVGLLVGIRLVFKGTEQIARVPAGTKPSIERRAA